MEPKNFDVVVIGGTSFVGQRFVEYYSSYFQQEKIRVLVTARNLEKLSKALPEQHDFTPQQLELTDRDEVYRVVKQGRIVVNFAGPFDLYAEHVVAACSEFGVHYVDITGEVHFAKRMIERYFDTAQKSGAVIVPFCGFDSIPADYSVFYAKEQLKKRGEFLKAVDLVFKLKSGFNGGTIATGKDMAKKQTAFDVKNRHYLIEGAPAFLQDDSDKPRYIPELKSWVSPLLMEPINSKIVYRSRAMAKEAGHEEPFYYRESFYIGKSFISNFIGTKVLNCINLFFKYEWTSKILDLFLPAPGEGPSDESIETGFFKAKTIARGSQGSTVIFNMTSQGDPSNRSTIKLIGSCMKCLLANQGSGLAGVLTPSIAFDVHLIDFLRNEGIELSEVETIQG